VRDTILVTGGAGFIGSNFILSWIRERSSPVVNLDLRGQSRQSGLT
jgi:dTDP-glucose 4,6-dehydratase